MPKNFFTQTKVIYNISGSSFIFEKSEGDLIIRRMMGRQTLDHFNFENDPVDFVADEVAMMMIELCPADITTDQQMESIHEEVYLAINMLYTVREFELNREKRKSWADSP